MEQLGGAQRVLALGSKVDRFETRTSTGHRPGTSGAGEVTISVADVDLLYLGLQLVITSIESGLEPDLPGGHWPKSHRLAIRTRWAARIAQFVRRRTC